MLNSLSLIIGAHYFGGWYNCSGLSPGCFSHFSGYTPRGEPLDNFFLSYPERVPLLGLFSTSLSTIIAEVHAADSALDFFQVLFYDGEVSCGFNKDPNLEHCLNTALACSILHKFGMVLNECIFIFLIQMMLMLLAQICL